MKIFKKVALLAFIATVFLLAFVLVSCGNGKEKSKIYIIPEYEFKSCVNVATKSSLRVSNSF